MVRYVLCALSGFVAPGGRRCLAAVRVPWLWPVACLSGVPLGPARCAAPRPVRSLSVLRLAFPTPWCLSPPRGLALPALLGGCAGHAEAGREPGSLCLPLAPAEAGALGSLRAVPVWGPVMGFSLAGPSGAGLGLRALRWFACVDPVTDASGFPYRLSLDRGLGRCTGAVSCGRRHLPLRVGGRHARVPCVCACARPPWSGWAGRPPGRVLVRLNFSLGRFVFLLCLAPSGLGLPFSWSFVCPLPPLPTFALFFFLLRCRFLRAPFVSCFLWFPAPGALGLGAVFVLLASCLSALPALWPLLCSPPGHWLLPGVCHPRLLCLATFLAAAPCLVFFFSSPFLLSAPPLSLAFSRFRPWVPWALVLGFAPFFLSASWLSVRSRLSCVSCLAVGCSFVVGAPPPPSVSCGVLRSRSPPFFFSASFVRPRYLWLSLVPCPGCPGPWCFPGLSLLGSGLVCVPRLAFVCSLVVAAPPPPAARCSFLFFFCAPVVSGFLWFPAPGALGLGAARCLLRWPPASRLSVPSRLFRASRLAVGCSSVVAAPPPPLFCLSVFVASARCCVPCAVCPGVRCCSALLRVVSPGVALLCAVLFCCARLVSPLVVPCPLALPVALGPCALRRCVFWCSPSLCVCCHGGVVRAVVGRSGLCCVCPGVLCTAFPVLSALCCGVLRCAGALALCCSCGACCCWCLVLWCAAVCFGVSFGVLWCGAGSGVPWLSAGAVLWRPAVRFSSLVGLVCVFSLCVRCCVALRVVLFGAGVVCAVVGASCCGVSLCVVVSPWAFCGVVVLWCVVVSCCAVRCPVVSCALCCVLRCCAALRCCAGWLCCAVV